MRTHDLEEEREALDRMIAEIRSNRAPGMFTSPAEAFVFGVWAVVGVTFVYALTFGLFSL